MFVAQLTAPNLARQGAGLKQWFRSPFRPGTPLLALKVLATPTLTFVHMLPPKMFYTSNIVWYRQYPVETASLYYTQSPFHVVMNP